VQQAGHKLDASKAQMAVQRLFEKEAALPLADRIESRPASGGSPGVFDQTSLNKRCTAF
jgi:hypothetical protein